MAVTVSKRWQEQAYTLLVYVALPFALLRIFFKGLRSRQYWHRWQERLGGIESVPSGGIWLHAVSVGEVQAVLPLIHEIQLRSPNLPITITTTTPTGWRRVVDVLGETVHHRFTPFDAPFAVRRFMRAVRPSLVLIVETEIWPNMLVECERARVPVVLANARLSERSAVGYSRVAVLARAAVRRFALIAAQDELDAQRFVRLGADAKRVQSLGNIKFDLNLPPSLSERAAALGRSLALQGRILIAASTHEGEEQQLLEVFAKVLKAVPGCRLLIAPRHPERFERVYEQCLQTNLGVQRRSDQTPLGDDDHLFLIDTLGELPSFFALADAAFVGGSFVEVGGHNILEPAALGVPVVFGPHMFNFARISQLLLEAGAAAQVSDKDQLEKILLEWMNNPAERSAVGDRARQVVERNRGALKRLIGALEPLLPRGSLIK